MVPVKIMTHILHYAALFTSAQVHERVSSTVKVGVCLCCLDINFWFLIWILCISGRGRVFTLLQLKASHVNFQMKLANQLVSFKLANEKPAQSLSVSKADMHSGHKLILLGLKKQSWCYYYGHS